jgi:TatD DNase family protein
MWFDTHAHLSDAQFDGDRAAVLAAAFERGVTSLVEIADGPDEWAKAKRLSEAYPQNIWWAAGLHPYYADLATPQIWKELKELSRHPRFVGLGEVGLDYAKSTIPADVQKTAFSDALRLALEIDKPLIIHCRNAYNDLHPLLSQFFKPGGKCPGVIHCFSGTQEDADRVLELGFYLGVDGPLTYPSAKDLRATFAAVPLNRIVLETDSPYLPPQRRRGQRNEPGGVIDVGEKLAEIRNLSVSEVATATVHNSLTLYRFKSADLSV